jgi:hypothetical protein
VRTNRLRAGVLSGIVAALIIAAPAVAAPPVAVNDTILAHPTGVQDVLANDRDPESDTLTVTGASDPAHGDVSCSALGACFYRSDPGYVGTDSFTYTLSAGGETASAEVAVTVEESVAASAIVARDDDVATLADRAITHDVLANDGGDAPLAIVSSGSPSHGTASCDPGGMCTYTPNAAFTGADGFIYTMTDESGEERTAAMHVVVAPSDSGFTHSVRGSASNPLAGGLVPAGGLAQWGFVVGATPSGISDEELGALPLPELNTEIGGPHAPTDGGLKAAKGWKVDGGKLVATDEALLGEASSRPFPRPLPPVRQGTGGDGHVPILVGSKVFAFYHHNPQTSVTCVDRETGELCAGYPKRLEMGTGDINGPGAVVGSKIWTHLWPSHSSYAQSAPLSLFCWDASTDSSCGLVIVERMDKHVDPGASAPVVAGGNVWFGGETGKLYCVDPSTNAPCATPSIATGMTVGADARCSFRSTTCWDIVTHDGLVFLSNSEGQASCTDVGAGAACAGWTNPQDFAGWNLVTRHDATGDATGVCVLENVEGECVPDGDPAARTDLVGFPIRDSYYSVTLEGEAGTRTLIGSLGNSGMGCWDWVTMDVCSGGQWGTDGWSGRDAAGNRLPDAYGVAWDGSCAVGVGDRGEVFTMDPEGNSPCTSLGSGAAPIRIDLRDQRCDAGVGGARWLEVSLSDTNADETESVMVTVRDAQTNEVLATRDVLQEGRLDLTGIDAGQHPAIVVDANLTANSEPVTVTVAPRGKGQESPRTGATAWDDGVPPRIRVTWDADPQPACLPTRGTPECSASATSPISASATMAGRREQAGLDLQRAGCVAVETVGAAAAPRKCEGRRLFRIRVRYRSSQIRRITVTANGVRQARVSMKGRPIFRIDLRKRPRQTTTVRIAIRTKSGKLITGKRVYHPCTTKLPGGRVRL